MRKLINFFVIILCAALLSCSPASPTRVLNPAAEKITDLTETFNPQVDILFVVDNSGSMSMHQAKFSDNVTSFTQEFIKQNLNYHLAIISTDIYDKGEFKGSPSFIENSTPDGLDKFANNIQLGTFGSGTEMFFDPIVKAFHPDNVNGINKDFLRSDSVLVVVLITDTEDQSSNHDAKKTFDFLAKLKGSAKNLMGYGVIIPSTYSITCERDEYKPTQLENFLGMFQNSGNNILGLCDADYGNQLAQFSKDIAQLVGNTIFLKRLPVLKTIKVNFGTQEIEPDAEKGWSYDIQRNALILGSKLELTEQPFGTKVSVVYESISD